MSVFLPLMAVKELNTYEIQRIYIEAAVENGSELNNVAITQVVVEANNWLAEAKASKSTLGWFSPYWFLDVENVEPISINQSTK